MKGNDMNTEKCKMENQTAIMPYRDASQPQTQSKTLTAPTQRDKGNKEYTQTINKECLERITKDKDWYTKPSYTTTPQREAMTPIHSFSGLGYNSFFLMKRI